MFADNYGTLILLVKSVLKLTLLHSEQPKLYGVLAVLSAIGLKKKGTYSSNPIHLIDVVSRMVKDTCALSFIFFM